MQSLEFNDWTIAYERMGSGPTLLFLHNGGTSHRIWLPVMEQLRDRYDVIAIDLLGYGQSSKPGDSYTMETYVSIVDHVLSTLDVSSVLLVGNCMGSAISVHYASQHPERVRGLVLVNPLTEATFKKGHLSTALKARQASPGMVGGLYNRVGKMRLPRWLAAPVWAFQLGSRGRKLGIHKDEALADLHASDGQLNSLLKVLEDIDAYGDIDSLSEETRANLPPIATFWGGSNRVLSAKQGAALNEVLQPVTTETLNDCGHLVMMEAPEELARFIEEFQQHRA